MDISISFLMSDSLLFRSLQPEESEIVEKKMTASICKAGSVLYKEGDHAKSMFFVASGTLNVVKKDSKGNQCKVATLTKGQCVGEMGMIDGMIRSATIIAATDSDIVVFRRDDFDKLLEEHPVIGIKILKEVARGLSLSLRKTSDDMTKILLDA